MRHLVVVTAIALTAASCGSGIGANEDGQNHASPPTTPPRDQFGGIARAPEVALTAGETSLSLVPWTACWGNGCYDGVPPEVLPDIGNPEEIIVEFPEQGWEFTATVQPVGRACGRHQTERLEPLGGTTHRLTPIGLADDYEVTLFGQGRGGDVIVSFRWQTPRDGILPVPAATASILADHDGQVDSYGVELSFWNLANTPADAQAQATVTSGEGLTRSFALTRRDFDCSEGALHFTAPIQEGHAAAELGSPPFVYEVAIGLDGVEYVGTAIWPDDVDPECSPCVPLTFSPPLPVFGDP